jgi:hypothetical protein
MDIFDEISQSSKGDIFDELTSQKKQFPWQAEHTLPQKLGRAYEAASEKPSLLASESPVALLQLLQNLGQMADPTQIALNQIPNQNKIPKASELASSFLRKNVPEELQQGAQDIADIEEFLLPIPLGGKAAKVGKGTKVKKIDAVQKMYKDRSGISSAFENALPETFESGLTKPRAVEGKFPSLATISKERQQKVIGNLDKEAQNLINLRLEERVPISKKIKEGFDFGKDYEARFGELKSMAEKANPEIETAPLSGYFRDTIDKYRGIPSPHADAKAVINEMKSFRKNMPGDLKDLLRIYRSNNQKLKNIYETRLLKGKRSEYTDFLTNMNKKIVESIENTLPSDSAWVKEFKAVNSEFAEFKSTQDTLRALEPLLREKLSSTSLSRLAEDPNKQKYLRLKMGDKGADEVIQIAKDLKKARESIKKLTTKKAHDFHLYNPFSWISKGKDISRRAYGYYLSTPERRAEFDAALKELSK